MRVGFVPVLDRSSGGIYQYSLALTTGLVDVCAERGDELVILTATPDHPALSDVQRHARFFGDQTPLRKIVSFAKRTVPEGGIRDKVNFLRRTLRRRAMGSGIPEVRARERERRWLEEQGIEIVVWAEPDPRSFEIGGPFVAPIHDLQHRIHPQFPEVSADGEWRAREYIYRNLVGSATLAITDSEEGADDVLTFYSDHGATRDRIRVLPFLPALRGVHIDEASISLVRNRYGLPETYLFYPAQFWPHKNHRRIVEALSLLAERNVRVDVVFSGSKSGALRSKTFNGMLEKARQGGVGDLIHYIGYAAEEDMAALYSNAAALIMPTFFGPTNIPILEAWATGCPVITSDIRGIREQAGQAAVLVDPESHEDIAAGIERVLTDEELRSRVAAAGSERLRSYTPDDYRRRLRAILEEAEALIGL